MCSVFVNADPELYSSYTRSIRLHGVSTSLRLERMFWDVLAEIGARDSMSVPQLIGKLHDELVAAGADLGNFASFLRVCCLRYLSLQAIGVISTDRSVPITPIPTLRSRTDAAPANHASTLPPASRSCAAA